MSSCGTKLSLPAVVYDRKGNADRSSDETRVCYDRRLGLCLAKTAVLKCEKLRDV
jgi:hypothetical protein